MKNNSENLKQLSRLAPFEKLVKVMKILRGPGGCPWDREQTIQTLRKFLLEETHEVAEAIDKGDVLHLCEELGDLAMIVVFAAQIATEEGTFTIEKVLNGIVEKLVYRHPHIFGEKEELTSDGVVAKWQVLKQKEKAHKQRFSSRMQEARNFSSPLQAARNIQQEAAKPGFDFPDMESAFSKLHEETEEIHQALASKKTTRVEEEIGDLLFSIVNVARMAGVDPDSALKQANDKFISRFSALEDHFEEKGGLAGKTIQEMDAVWNKVKKQKTPPKTKNG